MPEMMKIAASNGVGDMIAVVILPGRWSAVRQQYHGKVYTNCIMKAFLLVGEYDDHNLPTHASVSPKPASVAVYNMNQVRVLIAWNTCRTVKVA